MAESRSSDPFAEFAVPAPTGIEAWKDRLDQDRRRRGLVNFIALGALVGATLLAAVMSNALGGLAAFGLAIIGAAIGRLVGFLIAAWTWQDRPVVNSQDHETALLGWMTTYSILGTLGGILFGAFEGARLVSESETGEGGMRLAILGGGELLGSILGLLAWRQWQKRLWVNKVRGQIQAITEQDITRE